MRYLCLLGTLACIGLIWLIAHFSFSLGSFLRYCTTNFIGKLLLDGSISLIGLCGLLLLVLFVGGHTLKK